MFRLEILWADNRSARDECFAMTALRQHRIGQGLALILAVLFIVGAPARVLATADRCLPATDHPSAAAICLMTGKAGPCCCGSPVSSERPNDAGVSSPDSCGCSLKAPPPPSPAVVGEATRGFSVATVVLPGPPVYLPGPVISLRTLLASATVSPRASYLPSAPSRAPPACQPR
jgi:hypothetical protein